MGTVAKLQVIQSISKIQSIVQEQKARGHSVGLVPTMGSLHAGHLSLIKASIKENDITIVTVFVNPTQFGPNEDFDKYPRNLQKDLELCQNELVDYVFAPVNSEMYPTEIKEFSIVPPEMYTNVLCGIDRPGHFQGVATVVTKLFNIIPAHRAYFGQKDAQQLFIIKMMSQFLNIPIEIITCPIVRETDGLAMSSRNLNLNQESRQLAVNLYKALNSVNSGYTAGNTNFDTLSNIAKSQFLTPYHQIHLEYFLACDYNNLQPVKTLKKDTLLAIAARLGGVRLIDNIILR